VIVAVPTPPLITAAEATVVAMARLGDRDALTELIRRRQSHIRNLLRRLCRDTALADDLAQETFLRTCSRIGQLRTTAAFSGWLRQIAVNVWLQHARGTESFIELDEAQMVDHLPTTATQLDLDQALAELPPAVRLCIVLNYHEGLSHADIVAATQLPLGTVKSHIARGSMRLRERLAAYDIHHEKRHG
jgi:RNA polymerase sigma-70 factor (ECF subfamily)